MRVSQEIKKFAREDIAKLIQLFQEKYGIKLDCVNIEYDDSEYDGSKGTIWCTAHLSDESGKELEFNWEYMEDDENIYVDSPVSEWVETVHRNYTEANSSVKCSTAILAADEDMLDVDIPEDEDGIADDIDDLSDKVDDLQDSVDDIDPDDPSIEKDNNIENHYIAECDRCHGIFISAMIESDQEVKTISGVCPLCGKETDQTLRWIIRSVEDADKDSI